jgi:hypothetical protein
MLIKEIVIETAMVWARKVSKKSKFAPKLVQKFKCTSGLRAGKKVSNLAQCTAPIDVNKRNSMKLTRAKTKVMQARRAKKTKKINPAATMAKRLNKFRKVK